MSAVHLDIDLDTSSRKYKKIVIHLRVMNENASFIIDQMGGLDCNDQSSQKCY